MTNGKRTNKRSTKRTGTGPTRLNFLGSTVPLPVRARGPELKYLPYAGENVALYHNVPAVLGTTNLLASTVGTAYNNRIGNEITLKRISTRVWLSNKQDRSNVMYRISLVAVPYNQVDLDTTTEWFAPASSGNRILSRFTPYGLRVLYDKVINPDMFSTTIYSAASGAVKERSYYHEFDIPFNQLITYNTTNCDWQYAVLITAYDAYGTLTSDNIASYAYDSIAVFEDQ